MSNKSKELDVDFIGEQGPMTQAEEEAISQFIKTQKLLNAKKQLTRKKTTQQKKKSIGAALFNK